MNALNTRFSDLNKQGFMRRVYKLKDAKPKKQKQVQQAEIVLKPACADCQGGTDCACWIAYQIETFGSAQFY